MDQLTTTSAANASPVVRFFSMSFGRLAASLTTTMLMAPLLFIALLPISLFLMLVMPPVGMWLFFGSLFRGESGV